MAKAHYIADAYIQAGEESTFGNEASTIDVPFGRGQLITRPARNNLIEVRGLGDRNPQNIVAGKFEGAATVSFDVASGNFFKPVLGAVTDAAGSPDTHTYTESNTIPSFTLEIGNNLDTDSIIKLLGCKCNRLTLSGAVGETIKASMELLYADEDESNTGLSSDPAVDLDTPFTFAQMTIELPDGTTIEDVERFELTIENGLIPVYGAGSRQAQEIVAGARRYSMTIETKYEESARLLEKFYGGSSGPTDDPTEMVLNAVITNGESGDAERTIDITINGFKIDEHNYSGDAPEDLIKESVTGLATGTAQVIYSNGTATDAWS